MHFRPARDRGTQLRPPAIVPLLTGLAIVVGLAGGGCVDGTRGSPEVQPAHADGWSESELALMRSMSIDALPELPDDPSNRVADDLEAAELGQLLFFDPRLSSTGEVSCATCHDPARYFADGLPVSRGVGLTNRNSPTVVGSAWSPWLFWDGRRDSLWSQALAPFESAAEMNFSRTEVVHHVARDAELRMRYVKVFGEPPPALPPGVPRLRASPFGDAATQDAWYRLDPAQQAAIDRAFAHVGKALAAYQRRLRPGASRFDRYVRTLDRASHERVVQPTSPAADADADREPGSGDHLDENERLGLRLFLDAGRTQCLRCHNGPLFTNQGFHRIGTETAPDGTPEFGRFLGLQAALVDPFNCLGAFSDAKPEDCRELAFVRRDHLDAELGKFKTPTLRGARETPPYMHDGRFATLEAVIEHYRVPPPGGPAASVPASDPAATLPVPNGIGGHELLPLSLSPAESQALVAFLATLEAKLGGETRWHTDPRGAGSLSR